MEFVTIDFETEPIEPRPKFPPQPVGVSIKWPNERSIYWAWGHPAGNNCTRENARYELQRVWTSHYPVVCHNAPFDLSIAYERLGLRPLPWQRTHDTMFLLFLYDPHAKSLGL